MKSAVLLLIAFAGVNLRAATVIALFNGEITSESIDRYIGNDPTNPSGWVTTTTGMFSFTRTGGTEDGGPSGDFNAFCIEPREFVSGGSTYTYDFSFLSQGATNIGGMGDAKAALIDELFGRYYPVIGAPIDAEHASALQIAIWEIVRETAPVLDVYSGNVSYENAADPAALALAETYVQSLDGTGPMAVGLYALTADGVQDVVVQETGSFQSPAPEPVQFLTTGGVLIFLARLLRRR